MTFHGRGHKGTEATRIATAGPLVCLLVVALTSCPLPITKFMVEQLQDAVSPSIVIISPADESSYSATVVVSGSASDATGGEVGIGEIGRLSYETIPAMTPGGEIDVSADGSFSFSFPTTGFTGTLIVRVTAEDWNGQTSSTSITLHYAGNGIPTLAATPANKEITLTWDSVPLSTSYSLLYTTNGAIPSESYGYRIDGVSSPLSMVDLENGAMHVFVLQSHSSSGDDNWSDVVRAIPLSPATLTPTATGQYGAINVTWPEIMANIAFEVLRSTDPAGPFNAIATDAPSTGFADNFVQPREYYYYKVRPALAGSIKSAPGTGTPGVFSFGDITRIGQNSWPWTGYGLVARGDYVYIADGGAGLESYDVSEPWNPIYLDKYAPGNTENVALYGDYAYVAAQNGGLRIISVADPTDLTPVFTIPDYSTCYDVVVSGDKLYAAVWTDGVAVYDLQGSGSPAAPYLLGAYDTVGYAQSISVDGDRVAVATGTTGLVVLDTLTLPTITQWGSLALPGSALDVELRDDVAYVASQSGGLRVVDVSTGTFSTLGSYVDATPGAIAVGVGIQRNHAYVAYNQVGGVVLDIGDPTVDPVFVQTLPTGSAPFDAVADGDYVYFTCQGPGLQVYLSTLPTKLDIVGTASGAGGEALAVDGPYVYVANGGAGMVSVDVSDPTSPSVLDSFDTTGAWYDIVAQGGLAYISNNDGIVIVDVSQPSNLKLAGSFTDIGGAAWQLDVQGQYAYMSDYGLGLRIYDVSDPLAVFLAGASYPFYGWSIDVEGDFCYVTDNVTQELYVFDVSNPNQPMQVGLYGALIEPEALIVHDGFAYVGCAGPPSTVEILDVTDPGAISSAGSITGVQSQFFMYHDGSYLYLTDNDYTLRTIDVRDPANWRVVGTEREKPYGVGLAVAGKYAYTTTTTELLVIDLLP